MSEREATISERLERLERLFDQTRLPNEAIVGTDYVANLFDCTREAVMRGRFGTDKIPRVRQKPLGFKKGDVHRVLREMNEPVSEKAAEARAKARPIRRRSIIKRQVAK